MTNGSDEERLDALEARLKAARQGKPEQPRHESHVSQAQVGWRMVTELVVGILMGFGIGYGLDHLFGTRPIFLVVFTMFGFAAGVRTMMRTAAEIQAKNSGADDAPAASGQSDEK